MGYIDDFYEELSAGRKKREDYTYNNIIESFKDLSLEEKVNKLIEIYASDCAYGH